MITDKYQEEAQSVNKHVSLLIVDSTATVTAVPGDDPTVEDTEIIITNDIIDGESFDLYESLCSSANLVFGACESSHINLVIHSSDIPVTADRLLTVYRYLDHDSDTLMTIGTYRVTSDKYNADRTKRTIVMYDELKDILNLDMTEWYYGFFSDGEDTHTVKGMRDSFWTYLNANGFEVTQEDVDLPNDDMTVLLTIEDNVEGGKIIKDICQINGCFGHIDRSNTFRYVFLERYTHDADFEIPDADRIGNTTYQDYRVMSIVKLVLYDENNNVIIKRTDSGKTTYRIHDNSLLFGKRAGAEMETVIDNIYNEIRYKRYTPCSLQTMGNLAVEVGDHFEVSGRINFKSYVLTRHLHGIQTRFDTYDAKGDYRQPAVTVKSKTSSAASSDSESGTSYASGEMTDGKLVELIRNFGFRMPNEPTNVSVSYDPDENEASIKWTDPENITDSKPIESTWAGTVVVRTEGYPPSHRWDHGAVILYDGQTRNAHATIPLVDNTLSVGKIYYYGIFPYDYDGITKHYRWTKVVKVNTSLDLKVPIILAADPVGVSVEVTYNLPTGSYRSRKLVYKADDIPNNVSDGTAIDITPMAGGDGSVVINNLMAETVYYFVIFDESTKGRKASSEPASCKTGIVYDYDFEYTGTVQTFTAPKTGTYQLEVWGAQGQSDTLESESRRNQNLPGYSVGEIDLTRGTVLYICVGGKGNDRLGGYNGGMNAQSGDTLGYAGGGATHIAFKTGVLAALENDKDKVIIVAGGSGGYGYNSYPSIGVYHWGGSAGGFRGDTSNGFAASGGITGDYDADALQTARDEAGNTHLFGRGSGGTGTNYAIAGSGGGWYGGYTKSREGHGYYGLTYNSSCLSGGGSSYIGHPDLKNKCMYCAMANSQPDSEGYKYYSNAVSTKTRPFEGSPMWSNAAVSRKAKIGNGYAKIHYMGT